MNVYVLCLEVKLGELGYEAVFSSKKGAQEYLPAVKQWHKNSKRDWWESDWMGEPPYRWTILKETMQ